MLVSSDFRTSLRLAQQGGKAKAAEKQDTMFKENE
jgi:hypothetical protein